MIAGQADSIQYQLNAVFMIDGTPRSAAGMVTSDEPFIFETGSPWASYAEPGTRALFIIQEEKEIRKASGRVSYVKPTNQGFEVAFQSVAWESVDRRRYARTSSTVPVMFRCVAEDDDGARLERTEATTTDLSVGGASLSCPRPPVPGTLVDLGLMLGVGAASRALGLVVWSRETVGEFGVEFIDYVGDTKSAISEFLARSA